MTSEQKRQEQEDMRTFLFQRWSDMDTTELLGIRSRLKADDKADDKEWRMDTLNYIINHR